MDTVLSETSELHALTNGLNAALLESTHDVINFDTDDLAVLVAACAEMDRLRAALRELYECSFANDIARGCAAVNRAAAVLKGGA